MIKHQYIINFIFAFGEGGWEDVPDILTAGSPNSHFAWRKKKKWIEVGRWLMKVLTVVFAPKFWLKQTKHKNPTPNIPN